MTTSALYHCNFSDTARFLPKDIDLIYTDPPYSREQAVPCFRNLAFWAPQLLKDGGSLVTLVPHYLLEEVMSFFADERRDQERRLKFRWIYCLNQVRGPHPRMAMGIEVLWKPILHYVKRAYPQGRGFVKDMVTVPFPEKGLHEWQQSETWADYYIPKFTNEGDTVLDPFVGTGTSALASLRNGRNFIGIDNDENMVGEARNRIWNELSITTTVHGVRTATSGETAPSESGENTNVVN